MKASLANNGWKTRFKGTNIVGCAKCGVEIEDFKAKCMPVDEQMEFVCNECFKKWRDKGGIKEK